MNNQEWEMLKRLPRVWRSSHAHTYASENADLYRGFDNGQFRAAEELEDVLRQIKELEKNL